MAEEVYYCGVSRSPVRPRRPLRFKAFLAELWRQCRLANEAERRASGARRNWALWLSAQYLEAASDATREREARAWVRGVTRK